MALEAGIILFVVFAVLLVVGMPIGMSIAASSIATLLLVIPLKQLHLPQLKKWSLV